MNKSLFALDGIKTLSVIALCYVVTFSIILDAREMPKPKVNVAVAEMKMLSPVAWVSGTVISPNNSKLAAEVSGRLESISPIGLLVKKGEVIAKIDDSTLLLQQTENAASVKSAESRLSFLESEVKRKTSLAKRNLSAKTDLDQTLSQRDIAKGDLMAAKSRLAQTQQRLQFTQLKAPFDGLVAERLSNSGEFVNNGTAIVRLVQTDNLEASIFAPLTAYRFLKQAKELAVESALGKGSAAIKALVPVADSRSHLMEVRIDMSKFDWPVGLDIKVAINSGEIKSVLAVPRDALILRRNGSSVFRINSSGVAEIIPVKIGIAAGNLIEVIGNLSAGDQVVIRGGETLRPGQAVEVKKNNDSLVSS